MERVARVGSRASNKVCVRVFIRKSQIFNGGEEARNCLTAGGTTSRERESITRWLMTPSRAAIKLWFCSSKDCRVSRSFSSLDGFSLSLINVKLTARSSLTNSVVSLVQKLPSRERKRSVESTARNSSKEDREAPVKVGLSLRSKAFKKGRGQFR